MDSVLEAVQVLAVVVEVVQAVGTAAVEVAQAVEIAAVVFPAVGIVVADTEVEGRILAAAVEGVQAQTEGELAVLGHCHAWALRSYQLLALEDRIEDGRILQEAWLECLDKDSPGESDPSPSFSAPPSVSLVQIDGIPPL